MLAKPSAPSMSSTTKTAKASVARGVKTVRK
jgi:hypothetical protein